MSVVKTGWLVDGRYRIERLIGRGGVGEVYEATELATAQRVAVKLVLAQYAKDDGIVMRFSREAKAASAMDHPHIVRVLDSGAHEGRPFLVIELLVGEDLGERLGRMRRLSEKETIHVTLQVLQGLVAAHAAGIVHRDLKPDNVFLVSRPTDSNFVKIVDFGTSKFVPVVGQTAPLSLTRRGVAVGTPLYMSPEQADAKSDVDERTDLYSVGAIMFECLTGRPPHVGETDPLVLASIRTTKAPPVRSIEPNLDESLGALVDRALARDRAARFASARQMFEALAALAPDDPAAKIVFSPPRIVLSSVPPDPGLAFADTLPHPSERPRQTPISGRGAKRASNPAPRARSPSLPAIATPKARHFAWSWAAAFVAALGGVMTTAWIASKLQGPSSAEAPRRGVTPTVAVSARAPVSSAQTVTAPGDAAVFRPSPSGADEPDGEPLP